MKREREDRARLEALRLPIGRQAGTVRCLFLDGPCDADCIFCSNKTAPPEPIESVAARLDGRVDGGKLCIVGNEPLAHPHAPWVVARARAIGFDRVEVMTSGTRLAETAFAEELHAAGVTGYSIPLHSDRSEIHDAITRRARSCVRTRCGVARALRLGAEVHLHANLVRANLETARSLEALALERLDLPFAFLPVRPKTSGRPYGELAVSYEEVRRLGLRSLFGFPRCVGPEGGMPSDSLRTYFEVQTFWKPPQCGACAASASCAGSFEEHAAIFGLNALRPVEEAGSCLRRF